MEKVKAYYKLTKPGIVYGNTMIAGAGFLFASQGSIEIGSFLALVFGVALVIASACVVNNYFDRGIDAKMDRTKTRPLVSGVISTKEAWAFAVVLGLTGFLLLATKTNELTVLLGIIAFISYTIVYTSAKRITPYSTLIGSIPGALPPAAGYTAVTGVFDAAAVLLFLIMVCWQMPHFYAIGIFRRKEYKKAGLPVVPVIRPLGSVRRRMIFYTIAFGMVSVMLSILGYAGVVFALGMLVATVWWLRLVWRKPKDDGVPWARRQFVFSLKVLLLFALLLSLEFLLP